MSSSNNKWVWGAVVMAIALSSPPLMAGPGQGKGPKTTAVKPVKANAGKPVKTQASGAAAKPVKSKATATTSAKAPKSPKSPKSTTATNTTTPATTSTTTTTTGTTTTNTTTANTFVPTNAVSQKLSTKPNLMSKVKTALPAGTNLNQATAGFKNFGQFMAAVNVSNNLNIPFADLKASMTGTTLAGLPTNEPTTSLGQSIKRLRPTVDADAEAARATTQANVEAQ
jgi:hypothetical protein